MTNIVPRPAATVTLVRDAPGGFEVLMVQRNHQSVFMPGVHVFPGGALDAEDVRDSLCRAGADNGVVGLQFADRAGIERTVVDHLRPRA